MMEYQYTPEMNNVISNMKENIIVSHPSSEYMILHLICSIFEVKSSTAYKIMSSLLMSSTFNSLKDTYTNKLVSLPPSILPPGIEPKYSEELDNLLKMADDERENIGHGKLSSAHVLLALKNKNNSQMPYYKVFDTFTMLGLTYDSIKERIPNDTPIVKKAKLNDAPAIQTQPDATFVRPEGNFPYIKQYTTPVIPSKKRIVGRDMEVNMVFISLSKKTKNNVLLIGDSGVGKTAILEEIERRLEDGSCPEHLLGKKLVCLSITTVLAGTTLRGMVEDRMSKLMSELSHKQSNFILCIDGLGNAMKNQSHDNDLSPMIEELCANNSFQVIILSNQKEYHSSIEPNKRMNGAMTKIEVTELSKEQTLEVVKGLKSDYEDYHKVKFDADVINALPNVAWKYIKSKKLPSSAIELMDTIGASKCFEPRISATLAELKSSINELEVEKARAKAKGDFSLSEELSKKINGLKSSEHVISGNPEHQVIPTVTIEDMKSVTSELTGIKSINVSKDELESLKQMEAELRKHIVGQDDAIHSITRSIIRNKVGIKKDNKTIGSYLLVGPTGVGKTLMAKKISELVFGDQDSLIRIDMTEYSDKVSVGKLIGAAPGYVGYESGGQLTEKVKHKPYCVLLLDEIEKAHPEVINTFLQVLDDGRLSDNTGEIVDFTNVLVLMTSNIGARRSSEFQKRIGFSGEDQAADISSKELKKFFPPEFINRLDDVIYFNKLGEQELRSIAEIELSLLKERLSANGYTIDLYDTIVDDIIGNVKGKEEMGARPIGRAIQNLVENRITDAIVDGVEGNCITITDYSHP